MFNINGKNYAKSFILIIIIILISIYVSILKPIYNYDSSRIYNLTKVNDVYRVSLMNEFLDKQYVANSILVLGDSQANGFRYPTEDIFSTILSKKLNKKVINAAFRDARILDSIYVLEYLKSKNREFETIIFNINPAHPKEPDHYRLELKDWIDYKIGIFKNSNIFEDFPNNFNPETRPNFTFYEYPGLPNFFDMPKESLSLYLSHLEKLIILAKSISKKVIIYASPHYVGDFKRLHLDHVNIDQLEIKVQNMCKDNHVIFLKPDMTQKKYFDDIVHFNLHGHLKMAEILHSVITK